MEMFRRTDRVRNDEVSLGVQEERNIRQTIKRRKANWFGHVSRRNCLLKHVIEEKIDGWLELDIGRSVYHFLQYIYIPTRYTMYLH